MGVLNVTPDSFSDGGAFLEPDAAVAHGRGLVEDGAAILDIGGESTRPGAGTVSADEELRRVLAGIERLGAGGGGATLSIDTTKRGVAAAALAPGAASAASATAHRPARNRAWGRSCRTADARSGNVL